MTLNANGTFGEFASAKIFRDFRNDPVLDDVNPAYLKVIGALGRGGKGEVNGVPFAANASGLLYNEELFAKYHVTVPKTFDELIAAAKTFKAAGITPFYGMLADAWTAQSPLAPLSSQLQPSRLLPAAVRRQDHLREGWRSTATELGELYKYTQPDPLSKGYEDGTAAFAKGESAMLLLGSYAVPQIRAEQAEVHRRKHGAARDRRPRQDHAGVRGRRGDHGRPERRAPQGGRQVHRLPHAAAR